MRQPLFDVIGFDIRLTETKTLDYIAPHLESCLLGDSSAVMQG